MKDYALEIARSQEGSVPRLNALREYLQAYILRFLHQEGFFQGIAFMGGTALRFIHGLPRFSEDLDFSLGKQVDYSFPVLMRKLERELALSGYEVSVAWKEEKIVRCAFVKFGGLLYEAGLSPLASQKLSIKVEVDTRPPAGASFSTSVVNKYFPIAFLTFDLPSLFAGKLTALLCRNYTKGRDFFDLGWYLSRWRDLAPNIELLRNGVQQQSWSGDLPTERTWRVLVSEAVKKADWKRVREDVTPFLEREGDRDIFTQENVLGLVQRANGPS